MLHYTTFTTPQWQFRWHGGLTVNVYIITDAGIPVEVDVFTFAEQPTVEEVEEACEHYVQVSTIDGEED